MDLSPFFDDCLQGDERFLNTRVARAYFDGPFADAVPHFAHGTEYIQVPRRQTRANRLICEGVAANTNKLNRLCDLYAMLAQVVFDKNHKQVTPAGLHVLGKVHVHMTNSAL